jgi:predicted nuclease of predicted toxin-antitoxin system
MKLILDEGTPLGAAKALRDAGIEATHVLELALRGATDVTVLARARTEGAAVVTLDADFHQILATTGADTPSVIRVRIEGLKGRQLAAVLLAVLGRTAKELQAGAVVSVTPRRIRLRKLPIRE